MQDAASSSRFVAVGSLVAIVAILAVFVWRKGRPLAREGAIFRASRLSGGNHVFPTQVIITPTSVMHYTPQWIGKFEHSIHIAHVASVLIDTGFFFSDVLIETTGGASPIRCHGHPKSHAVRMKQLVEQYQSEYYRDPGQSQRAVSRD